MNEERYQKNKNRITKVALIVLIVGLLIGGSLIVTGLMKQQGYKIGNVDAVVIAQRPKIGPHFPAMKTILAKAMECEEEQLNLKATTEEKLGFTGREEGMAAQAVCLLERV